MERAGDYERAAFCSLFTGSVDRALEALEASGGASSNMAAAADDGPLTLLPPPLAFADEKYLTMVLLIRSRSNQSPRDSYAIASSRLISKLDSVEVRAVCRFGLTGDWEEVLNEAGGSVLDTLGLALKWAPDGIVRPVQTFAGCRNRLDAACFTLQLRQYLRSSRNNAVASGDLMGLGTASLSSGVKFGS
jgi:hypothetical protein